MNETETPYTDAKAFDSDTGSEVVRADDCRAIERAAGAMREALIGYRAVCGNTGYQISRDSARELYNLSGDALDSFAALRKKEQR